jgi:hypothetical protein
VSAGATKHIAKVVTELSAEGSDNVMISTTTAIARPLCEATERIKTVVWKKQVAGVVVSERTTTSVIFEGTEQTIVDAERGERIRKLGLVDCPIEGKNRPAHPPPTVDAALRRFEMAELCAWLNDSRRDLRKGRRPVLQKGQIEQAVARHFDVSTVSGYVRRAVRWLRGHRAPLEPE